MEKASNTSVRNSITILISLAFAGFFLWLALKDLEIKIIQQSLAKANYWWVILAAVFGLGAYWFRAVRWNLLFEPMGYKISNANSLWSLSFGYLMNLTIPRSGELARATALYGVEKVPVDKSFGTIILERVVDLLCMILFLGLTLMFKFEAISSFYEQSGVQVDPSKIFIVIGVLALAGVLFFSVRNKLLHVPVLGKIVGFINGIISGLTSIFKLKQKMKFIFLTAMIWICYYFAAYLVCFSLPETSHLGFADGFYLLVVGTLGMIIPASGGIGAFNLAMKFGFMALFISMGMDGAKGGEVGLIYSFISLPLQIIIMLIMGFISIPMLAKARKF